MTLHELTSCLANISEVLDQNNTKRPTEDGKLKYPHAIQALGASHRPD
jgi:hypothetical protein